MLQTIRDRAQGLFAWAIVILITIPFALWGIQSYLGVGAEPVVASVNDRDITERELNLNYQRFSRNLRQQLGDAFRPEMFDETRMRQEVLESMVRNELVLQAAEQSGLRASDLMVRSAIENIPEFQTNGRFDAAAYQQGLRQQSYSQPAFEQEVRRMLVSDQFSRAVIASELITSHELEQAVRLQNQRRELSYVLLPVAEFVKTGVVSDEQIKAHYEANQAVYMAPERVRVDFLELDIAHLADTIQPDEEALRSFFEQTRQEYSTLEQRRASHILIALDEDADEAAVTAARDKALALLERLRAGEDFAAVAKEASEDPGSAELGGDLGFVEKDMMDPVFEAALFQLGEGELSEPVQSAFGFHIIQLTELRAGHEKSFEEARDAVAKAYRRHEAERLFYEQAEQLGNLAYEVPDSLEPAAQALGLRLQTSGWLIRGARGGLPGGSKAVEAAFSDDVLVGRQNSEVIELNPEHLVVLRVRDHAMAAQQPLDEVREEIVAVLEKQQAAEAVKEKGADLLARLRQGETLEQVAAAEGRSVEGPRELTREQQELPAALVQSLFQLPRPNADQPVYGQVQLDNGDYALIALHRVQDGVLADMEASERQALQASLQRSRGRSNFDHLLQHLRNSADVNIKIPTAQ